MASEASWQSSGAPGGGAFTTDQPMDQRTVESLLRRLVERVEDSERRYGEALDQLHARLDQLSQTTEAARETGAPENADTFDRLHTQVSNLARRLEQETSAPLDDFERLGRALSGGLPGDAAGAFDEPFGHAPELSAFAQATMAAQTPGGPEPRDTPEVGFPDFSYAAPTYATPPVESDAYGAHDDLDKRLVAMAQRLEESIGTAMPTGAIEALNTRLDEIGGQLSQALDKAPTRQALEHVEQQLSDMSQQVSRAEEQLGKVSGIEAQLLKLIARVDEKSAAPAPEPAQLEEIANKAATEAARRVAAEAKQSTERLDAMHRDLTTMSNMSRESGDRLVGTLEAVHESLKQLVQQVEQGAPALQPKARAPFLEQPRQADAKPAQPQAKAPMPHQRSTGSPAAKTAPAQTPNGDNAAGATKERSPRDRLGGAIPDFKETEAPPPFGRSKRLSADEEAVDLDATQPRRGEDAAASHARSRAAERLEQDAPDDLVAAARRAAQAASLRADARGGRRSTSHLSGSAPGAEPQGRRKRSMLMIAAAALLLLSAALLYGRLMSKPETEATSPIEQITPPADATDGTATPGTEDTTTPAMPEKSGSWTPLPESGEAPSDSAASQGPETTGFTEMAKSSGRVSAMPANELTPEPQLASLHPGSQAVVPPGVVFSIEDPTLGPDAMAATRAAAPFAMPAELPMPPAALGPQQLREAAAKGDAQAQYAIAIRYVDGTGTAPDLKEAARWLERAAGAGLAPAQYRLAAMYERGLGVDKDLGRARTWYAAAAEKGNIKAMHNLAVSVSGRDGGKPDYKLAAKWYGRAAAYGLADSQFNLGILAEHGLGMTKSLTDAYQWFSLAAAKGDSDAAKRREVIRVQLAPTALVEAEAAVKAWKAKDAPAVANEVAEQPAWAAKAPATQNVSLVSRAQTLLNTLGYDVGPPDGLVGSRTRKAIELFQSRNGLEANGQVTIPLVTTLEHLTS